MLGEAGEKAWGKRGPLLTHPTHAHGPLHTQTCPETPTLHIGNHLLHGKVVMLAKPLALARRAPLVSGPLSSSSSLVEGTSDARCPSAAIAHDTTLLITAIIREKFVFTTRPRHILSAAHHGKTGF